MRAILTTRARLHLREIYDWYAECSASAADGFFFAFDDTIARLERFPESAPRVVGEVRRTRLRRYPYHVIYLIRGERLAILGIRHTKRGPEDYRGRQVL